MSSREKIPDEAQDPLLEEALRDFRLSVQVWSEAELSRPRMPARAARHGSWRPAAAWALGCLLAAGSLSGGWYEHHHRQEAARIAAAAQAARQRQLAADQSTREEDENLLATVDSEVSREVPSAMEPLAQLMDEDGSR
jgi:hypothetical protein